AVLRDCVSPGPVCAAERQADTVLRGSFQRGRPLRVKSGHQCSDRTSASGSRAVMLRSNGMLPLSPQEPSLLVEEYTPQLRRLEFAQRRHAGGGVHPLAEFDVDLPRLDQAVLADDELGRHGKKEPAVALIPFQVHAGLLVEAPDLGADPEDQAERERIAEI